jgi:hypothetical protein
MAMHKPKKTKRFQPGGLVDSERNPVRDGSNQPIMTGSFPEEDEITARGRAKNAEMLKSFFNRATGRGKSAQDEAGKVAQMAAAKEKLAGEVQEMVKAKTPAEAVQSSRASDDGMDESDRRREAAASAPKRMPTRPGQGTSTPKPSVSKAPVKPKTSSTKPKTSTPAVSSSYRSEGAGKTKPADKPPAPAASNKKPEEPNIVKIAKGLRARGEADLEARGLSTSEKAKPPAQKPEPTAASYSNEGRGRPAAATKKPEPFEMPVSKFFRGLRERGDADLKSRGMAKGGSVSSASKRADGIAQRGKTRGKVY